MANQTPLLSPTKNHPSSPISSILSSPRFFNVFFNKTSLETEASVMSPTSILDTKSSSIFVNPFGYDKNSPKPQTLNQEKAIGLALIDSIIIEEEKIQENSNGSFSKPVNRMGLFGSKLKVQIPVTTNQDSPKSQSDFGIKTRISHVQESPSRDFKRQLSLKEMEMSEEYTCVITHGPNPKTTHIFEDCVMERWNGEDDDDDDSTRISEGKKQEWGFGTNDESASEKSSFLSFCHTCKDSLGQGKDIYIYRGEKGFCSNECRCQEIFNERLKNPEMDDAF